MSKITTEHTRIELLHVEKNGDGQEWDHDRGGELDRGPRVTEKTAQAFSILFRAEHSRGGSIRNSVLHLCNDSNGQIPR